MENEKRTVAALLRRLDRLRRKRKALLYLAELEDWQLDDIGLSRGEIAQRLDRGHSAQRTRSGPD